VCARDEGCGAEKGEKEDTRAENTSLFHPDARFMLYTKSCLQQCRRAPSGFDCMIASFIKLGRARYFKFMLSDNCTHVRPTGTKCCGQHDGIMKKNQLISRAAARSGRCHGFFIAASGARSFPKVILGREWKNAFTAAGWFMWINFQPKVQGSCNAAIMVLPRGCALCRIIYFHLATRRVHQAEDAAAR
jgi:hypothetical protein